MTLEDFNLLADENVHPEVVRFLRAQGHDVFDVKEAGLAGSSDRELIRIAHAQQRVIVTHDRDFGRLVFLSDEPFFGIVYLRPGHIDPTFTIATWRTIQTQHLSLSPPFLLVAERRQNDVKLRLRHLD